MFWLNPADNEIYKCRRAFDTVAIWEFPDAIITGSHFGTLSISDIQSRFDDGRTIWYCCDNLPIDVSTRVPSPASAFRVVWRENNQIGTSLMQTGYLPTPMGDYAQIDSAEIRVKRNPTIQGRPHNWIDCTTCSYSPSHVDVDIESSFAHEYGHVLGLGHFTDPYYFQNYLMSGQYDGRSYMTPQPCEEQSVMQLYNCQAGSALFVAFGMFSDTAYCETYLEAGTDSINLYGFMGSGSYPNGGVALAHFPPTGGPGKIARYQAPAISGYDYYEWREHSAAGSGSGPFGPTARPDDYYRRFDGGQDVDSLSHAETSEEAVMSETVLPPIEANCADIVVYASSSALADPIYNQIVTDAPGLRVRKILARPVPLILGGYPDRSAQACKNAIAGVIAWNEAWNAYCTGPTCRQYPVSPGPEVYIVGDSWSITRPEGPLGQPVTSPIGVGTGTSPNEELACQDNCRSDFLIYDLDNDGDPEGPIARVPAWTGADAQKAAWAAQDVNRGRNVDSGWHVTLLAGKMSFDPYVPGPLLNQVKEQFRSIRYTDYGVLDALSYPATGSATNAFDARFSAFSSKVAAGTREVFGYGGETWTFQVPGNFIKQTPYDDGRLSTKSRLVMWMPGCGVHASYSEFYSNVSVVRALMFGDTTKTMVAASVSNMDAGYYKYHRRMGELLSDARADGGAGGGRRSVARIAYDAVVAAMAEGGYLGWHSMTTSAWGSYTLVGRGGVPYQVSNLTAGAGRTTAAISWTEPAQENGEADEYEIRYQADTPLSEGNFGGGTLLAYPGAPGPEGTLHCREVSGLTSCRTYYFAIRTKDAGAWSPISNVASVQTTCSGSVIAMCEDEGLMGGGGGGGFLRTGRPIAVQGTGRMVSADGSGELSLLRGQPGVEIQDLCRVPSLGVASDAGQALVLWQRGNRVAELARVSLGYVDHPEGTVALAAGDSVVTGASTTVQSVVDQNGQEVAVLRDQTGPAILRAGESLVVNLGRLAGRTALVIESRSSGGHARSDSIGIDVQVPDGQDGWRSIARIQPRREFDKAAVLAVAGPILRLICLRDCLLGSLGRVSNVETMLPTRLVMSSGIHSRRGSVREGLESGSETVALASAESLVVAFARVDGPVTGTRDHFLTMVGRYEIGSSADEEHSGLQASPRIAWSFSLAPAYPNPSGGRVSFSYTLAHDSRADLRVYDVAGRLVRALVGADQPAGPHEIVWDGRNAAGRKVPPGVYFYRLQAGGWHSERKLVVLQK